MFHFTMYRAVFRYLLAVILLLLCAACGGPTAPTTPEPPPLTTPQAPADAAPLLPTVPAAAPDILAAIEQQRTIGNHQQAAQLAVALLADHANAAEARQAHYYLAESFALRERWLSAQAAWQDFLARPEAADALTPRALFWLARSHEELGNWEQALAAYEKVRERDHVLLPYVLVRQAALYAAQGNTARAADLYTAVGATEISPAERAGSYERAIALAQQAGNSTEALRLYQALLDFASVPAYRARLLAEAAPLAEAQGNPALARSWREEMLRIAPYTAQAVAAANGFAADSSASADVLSQAGRVLYLNELYQQAIAPLERAHALTPADSEAGRLQRLELRRLRAMSLRNLGNFDEALGQLAAIVSEAPDSEPGRQARLDWVQTVGQSGDTEQAIAGYIDYASSYPDDPRAPAALDRAAQLRERLADTAGAMRLRVELGERFPASGLAAGALNRAGWHYYFSGQAAAARHAWETLATTQQGYEQARGAFWAGRLARAAGDTGEARRLFDLAAAAAPNSYYGVRAAEELGTTFAGTVTLGTPITPDEWHDLAGWLDGWAAATDYTGNAQALFADTQRDDPVQRAIELAAVGLSTEAINEWNHLGDVWAAHPLRLAALARAAHEAGATYSTLKLAERLRALIPADTPPHLVLERLIFPTPYARLVQQESATYGVDPRLFYALMRQESLFNPNATSWVGARGLAQVMPATGEGIATSLGVADFHIDELYRPAVSVRFGAYYISNSIRNMDGSIHGGLAAYNGGLGNALRWAGGSQVADADLFTETIDFPETEGYVKHVYGYYGAYQRLYRLEPPE